jgi:hypothetical protein
LLLPGEEGMVERGGRRGLWCCEGLRLWSRDSLRQAAQRYRGRWHLENVPAVGVAAARAAWEFLRRKE